jgi:Fe2+ or Zn2+ uptake regulation protein
MPETPPNLAIVAVVGEADGRLTIAEIVDRVQATSKQAVASMNRRQIRNCVYNLERSGFMTKHCGEGETAVWSLSDRVRPEARSFTFPAVSQFEIDRS